MASIFEIACAIALLAVLANALRPRPRPDEKAVASAFEGELIELKVEGMRCNGCVTSIQRALSEISGVSQAEVDLEEGRARIHGRGVSADELIDAVTSLGFSVEA